MSNLSSSNPTGTKTLVQHFEKTFHFKWLDNYSQENFWESVKLICGVRERRGNVKCSTNGSLQLIFCLLLLCCVVKEQKPEKRQRRQARNSISSQWEKIGCLISPLEKAFLFPSNPKWNSCVRLQFHTRLSLERRMMSFLVKNCKSQKPRILSGRRFIFGGGFRPRSDKSTVTFAIVLGVVSGLILYLLLSMSKVI